MDRTDAPPPGGRTPATAAGAESVRSWPPSSPLVALARPDRLPDRADGLTVTTVLVGPRPAVGHRLLAGRLDVLHRARRQDPHPHDLRRGPHPRPADRRGGAERGRDARHRHRPGLRDRTGGSTPASCRTPAAPPTCASSAGGSTSPPPRWAAGPTSSPACRSTRPASSAATPAAGRASAPTAASGWAPATPPPARCPRAPRRSAARCCASTPTAPGVAGNAPAPFDPRIYSYGHRNVQGIAFSPGGRAYSIEHGTDRDDEVNRLVAGANYGWDPRPAGRRIRLRRVAADDRPRPSTPTPGRPVWSSGSPTIAPSGGTFLTGAQWAGWDRALAMAVLKGQQLRVLGLRRHRRRRRAAVGAHHRPGPPPRGGPRPRRQPLPRHRRRPRHHPQGRPRPPDAGRRRVRCGGGGPRRRGGRRPCGG